MILKKCYWSIDYLIILLIDSVGPRMWWVYVKEYYGGRIDLLISVNWLFYWLVNGLIDYVSGCFGSTSENTVVPIDWLINWLCRWVLWFYVYKNTLVPIDWLIDYVGGSCGSTSKNTVVPIDWLIDWLCRWMVWFYV